MHWPAGDTNAVAVVVTMLVDVQGAIIGAFG
jgi:hypothetical protein